MAQNNLTIYSKTLLIIFFLFTHGIHLVPWWLQFLFVSNLIKGSFWCASWTAWPVRPTYAFLSRSRPDRQTAAALLTRLTQHTNHATCCRAAGVHWLRSYCTQCTLCRNSCMHACTKPDTVEQTHPQERITSGLFLIHYTASNRVAGRWSLHMEIQIVGRRDSRSFL